MQALIDYIEDLTNTSGLSSQELIDAANDFNGMVAYMRGISVTWTAGGLLDNPKNAGAGEIPAFIDDAIELVNSKIQELADYLQKQEQYFIDCAEETAAEEMEAEGYIREVSSARLSGRI